MHCHRALVSRDGDTPATRVPLHAERFRPTTGHIKLMSRLGLLDRRSLFLEAHHVVFGEEAGGFTDLFETGVGGFLFKDLLSGAGKILPPLQYVVFVRHCGQLRNYQDDKIDANAPPSICCCPASLAQVGRGYSRCPALGLLESLEKVADASKDLVGQALASEALPKRVYLKRTRE